jgi:O-antigen ligase
MTRAGLVPGLTRIGRALFLAGIFLMVTGDWPRFTLPQGRGWVPFSFLAWPWLYLTLLAVSFVLLVSTGALRVTRPTTADFLRRPIALLTGAFLLSVLFSQIQLLSWWAFSCVVAVAGFSLVMIRVVDSEVSMAEISIAIAVAAVFLAVRVIVWRVDEGLTAPAFHVRNNAWLGKIQISWVLNLLAPLLLGWFLSARAITARLLYGGAWLLGGAAIYVLFSRMGVVTFPLTALVVCALNPRYWRRWVPLLAISIGAVFALIAVKPALISTYLIVPLKHPGLEVGVTSRQSAFGQTVRMIADHPVVGIGLGTYDHIAHTDYGPIAKPWYFKRGWHAHNTPLHILAETGAVGFLAWCYLWFTIVRVLLWRWRDGDRLGRLHSSAALSVILAFSVLSMAEAATAARFHAGLRMNLTVALLVIVGIHLSACARRETAIPSQSSRVVG